MSTHEIIGRDAIKLAETTRATLRAHADPTGAVDREVTIEEAREIADEDPALVYVLIERAPETAAHQAHLAAARLYFGDDAPADVLAAKARCYAWRPFAKHTDEERAIAKADAAKCDAYEAARPKYDLPGADPMGDES